MRASSPVLVLLIGVSCGTPSRSVRGMGGDEPSFVLNGPTGYTMTASGSALDSPGATVTLSSETAERNMVAAARAVMSADSFRGRRVQVSAMIDTKDAGWSSVWVRVDSGSVSLALENGAENRVSGTATARRQVSIDIPRRATSIVFGLMLGGRGTATARQLRLTSDSMAITAEAQLDSAIRIAKTFSLWRDTVTWNVVERDVRARGATARSAADAYPAIRLLLQRLGDGHSFVIPPLAARANAGGGALNPRPEVRLAADSIGYVRMFGYSGGDRIAARQYAQAIQDSLSSVMRRGARCRWIVDLRSNTGGNMWPMLGGLRPLLGESELGSFVGGVGPPSGWRANAMVDIAPDSSLARLESSWVAVLTGPRTASSGEAVTTAFRGRPRTRSFGEPTAGLSTANRNFMLPDGGMMLLTVSVYADRTGARTGHKMSPDEMVPADSARDAALGAASSWLSSRGCGGDQRGQ